MVTLQPVTDLLLLCLFSDLPVFQTKMIITVGTLGCGKTLLIKVGSALLCVKIT